MMRRSFETMNSVYRKAIETELKSIMSQEACRVYPALMKAMSYSLEAGGKRIRPCLTLATCDLFGGDQKEALPIAAALEMIHTYSLIHDDLPCMDDDDTRRGQPSNHRVFGEAVALLAGDGLLSFAFEYMMRYGLRFNDPNYYRAVHEVVLRAGVSGMVSGQAADLDNETGETKDLSTLQYVHTHKTADMIIASVLSGAYVSGAGSAEIETLNEYSAKLGLLFQITDDILDSSGIESAMGKTLGKDAEQDKLTYVTLLGEEGARKAALMIAEGAKNDIDRLFKDGYLVDIIDQILHRGS